VGINAGGNHDNAAACRKLGLTGWLVAGRVLQRSEVVDCSSVDVCRRTIRGYGGRGLGVYGDGVVDLIFAKRLVGD